MMAPLTPHVAEELWQRLGHAASLAYEPFPVADPALLVDDIGRVPGAGQRQGARATSRSPRRRPPADVEAAALADAKVVAALAGRVPKKVIVVPGRLVNIVV